MMASTQPGCERKPVRQARNSKALKNRYRASGALAHVAGLAGGVAIGVIIVLFFWLMVG
jgi:hypothetical protein